MTRSITKKSHLFGVSLAIAISLIYPLSSIDVFAGDRTDKVKKNSATLSKAERSFLGRHWPVNIPLQGEAPVTFTTLETSLSPDACGSCHQQQYKDWQTSLHSKSMGPGVLGQVMDMVSDDPATAKLCWHCHTPLAEQQDVLASLKGDQWKKNQKLDVRLQRHGLVCAGCHVRKHQRFGPPRSSTPEITGKIGAGKLPHGGFTAETAFTKSGFCAGCHQFTPNDYALNGKLIENTYVEWSASKYAKEGVQCQDCHMPDRRHLWRGIHDPDMVKQGVDISVDIAEKNYRKGDTIDATITVTNTGVGHYFPTYLTPKVFIKGYLIDSEGNDIEDTLLEAIIGREVTMDLADELYDTRIPPGESLSVTYSQTLSASDLVLVVRVVVEPDHFYERFFEQTLDEGYSGKGRSLLVKALENTRRSAFTIFEQHYQLGTGVSRINNVNDRPEEPPLSHAISAIDDKVPDWNAQKITWLNYDQGLKRAQETNQPILLVFYAQWCPVCHAYKNIFYDQNIVEAVAEFVMVRIDVDKQPNLSSKFSFDGEYVPRTFVLDKKGKVMHDIYSQRAFPKYFLDADDPAAYMSFLNMASNHN